MDIFKIVFTVSILFTLTICEDQILSIELSLSDIASSVTAVDKVFSSLRTSNAEEEGAGTSIAANLMTKTFWDGLAQMAKLLDLQRRTAGQVMPHVQVGLGVPKSPIVQYPSNYFVNRLKTLLKLQKKEDERNKPLNPPGIDDH